MSRPSPQQWAEWCEAGARALRRLKDQGPELLALYPQLERDGFPRDTRLERSGGTGHTPNPDDEEDDGGRPDYADPTGSAALGGENPARPRIRAMCRDFGRAIEALLKADLARGAAKPPAEDAEIIPIGSRRSSLPVCVNPNCGLDIVPPERPKAGRHEACYKYRLRSITGLDERPYDLCHPVVEESA